jgi:hypothetical protein
MIRQAGSDFWSVSTPAAVTFGLARSDDRSAYGPRPPRVYWHAHWKAEQTSRRALRCSISFAVSGEEVAQSSVASHIRQSPPLRPLKLPRPKTRYYRYRRTAGGLKWAATREEAVRRE